MPDSNKNNPTVVVTDGGGGMVHAGEGKRAADQPGSPESVGTKVVVSSPSPGAEPPWQASWPVWAKMTWSYGPFLIILLIYLNNERERSAERREDRALARETQIEERELRKYETTQRDRESAARERRDDSMISELRAITSRIDAERAKDDAENKLRKQVTDEAVEKIGQLVKDMGAVIEALKRLKVMPAPKKATDPKKAAEPGGDDRPAFLFSLPLSVPTPMPEGAPAPRLVGRAAPDDKYHTAGHPALPDAVTGEGVRDRPREP